MKGVKRGGQPGSREPKEVKRSPASVIGNSGWAHRHETKTGEHGQQARQAAGTIDSAAVLSGAEVVPRLDSSRKPHSSADMHHHVSYASH